jgi:hypothetical protein
VLDPEWPIREADICGLTWVCPLCAISGCEQSPQHNALFDHLIDAGQHQRRYGDAEHKRDDASLVDNNECIDHDAKCVRF